MGTLRRDINYLCDTKRKSDIQLDGPRINGAKPAAFVISSDSTGDVFFSNTHKPTTLLHQFKYFWTSSGNVECYTLSNVLRLICEFDTRTAL